MSYEAFQLTRTDGGDEKLVPVEGWKPLEIGDIVKGRSHRFQDKDEGHYEGEGEGSNRRYVWNAPLCSGEYSLSKINGC